MAEAIHEADATRSAVISYGASLFVTSLLLSLLWGSVVYDRKLLMTEVDDQEDKATALALTPSMGLYVAIIALAIVVPRVLRAHGERTPSPTAGAAG